MTVQRITDRNYSSLKQSERAALVVGATWCPACHLYDPTMEWLADSMHMVDFGKAEIDKGNLRQLKRDYPLREWDLPTTLLFREGRKVGRLVGAYSFRMAFDMIMDELVVGSTVYVPSEDGDVPARIERAQSGLYIMELLEDSSVGKKTYMVELQDGTFKWKR